MDGAPVAQALNVVAGTASAAIAGFYRSAEYKALARITQATYRNTLERFRKDYGHLPLGGMRTVDVNRILDSVSPGSAVHLRKRLHQLFEYAIGAGLVTANPVKDAKRVGKKTKGYRTWSEFDIAAYRARWGEGTRQRLAMEILLYTGLRRADAVRLGWRHIAGDRIEITASKTGAELSIPIHEELWRFLKELPRTDPAFIVTAYGKQRSDKAFTAFIAEAAAKSEIKAQASPHGLRKAACRRLAEAGASAHEIMSITGHTKMEEILTYTRAAEQKRLSQAAMAKMAGAFDLKLPNLEAGLGNTADKALETLTAVMDVARPTGLEPVFPP
ncbi:tyrosine-type recombinase/integrase [Pseudaminobacter sp. 19-2017]|uniref:Tyrosine-type recombinase/integrase n=1 Tax=Pseudaminobacter soli (ex Zhang et al. 2022) TaxID=2831468 RepID=A0A942E278_9HYPH|nr:tyrosine-type recombinase/integrase [Pseudaminobacter soli]